LYQDLVPLVNSGEVALLDNETLITQLTLLERRTGRGRIKIDHPHGGHDDLANAVALVFDLFRESSDLFFVDPEKPLAPAAEEIYQQEQERERGARRERAERTWDGSDFFSQSLSMNKTDF